MSEEIEIVDEKSAMMQMDERTMLEMSKKQQRMALILSGSLFKTLANNEQYLQIYAQFLKKLYDKLVEAGFTEDQAFDIIRTVATLAPPVRL